MASANHYDVIIIGTGAGGGTLLHRLAPSGKRILILERGEYVPREKDNWDSRAVNVEAKYHTKAVSHEPRIQQLSDDLARQGLTPFHVPLGIRLAAITGSSIPASSAPR